LTNQVDNPAETVFPFSTEAVQEASAVLLVPRLKTYFQGKREYIPSKAPVFYNPLMAFNRDLAVLVLRTYQRCVNRRLVVCDPFTGCGVRGIRFAKEVHQVRHVVGNDVNPQAVALTRLNVARNGLSAVFTVHNVDAHALLEGHARPKRRFDVIDLDPFGSPSPFLDSALRATKRGGLLALTATDLAPLCGVKSSACVRKYLGKPLRTEYCHEVAVRLVLHALVRAAAKHDLGIHVLFSHSTDHYIRVYAQIFHGATRADESLGQLGYITHCFHCLNRTWSRGLSPFPPVRCNRCGADMDVAGPLWLGHLFDVGFCEQLLDEAPLVALSDAKRAVTLVTTVLTEADGPPTYFVMDRISSKLGLPGLSKAALLAKLVEHGYLATATHFNPQGIRSNAPISVINTLSRELSRG
jgi:tRNA (guanine26-N2/guanine27-N2)-dimethyltransferase